MSNDTFVDLFKTAQNKQEEPKPEDKDKEEDSLIWVGDSEAVEKANDGVYWVRVVGENKEIKRRVIGAHFDVLSKYYIDDQPVFRIKTERETYATYGEIIELLKREGYVLDKGKLENAVSAITNEVKETKTTHGAIGVYDRGGALELCIDPISLTSEQGDIMQKLKSKGALEYSPLKEDIEAYLKFTEFFKKQEIYPLMGFAAAAPFNLLFKKQSILVPILYIYAKERNVGKSKAMSAFSQKLYGMDIASAEKILSDFRFNEIMDSCCLPLGFDEGERINFDRMIILREACENEWLSARGKSNLTMQRYKSRAMPIFTGNDYNAKKPETLKRMIIIHFNEQRKLEKDYWQRKKELDALYPALQPIGYDLIKNAVEEIQTIDELLKRVYSYANELETVKTDWVDATKPRAWAICYLGLKLWEDYANKQGVEWKAPSIEEFIGIVNTIESSTWETSEDIIVDFRDWFEGWIALNYRKGEGEIWKLGAIGETEGYFITSAVLREYNKDRGSEHISNLKRIAEAVISAYSIPREEMLDDNGKPKVMWLDNGSKRVVFVPEEGHGGQDAI